MSYIVILKNFTAIFPSIGYAYCLSSLMLYDVCIYWMKILNIISNPIQHERTLANTVLKEGQQQYWIMLKGLINEVSNVSKNLSHSSTTDRNFAIFVIDNLTLF